MTEREIRALIAACMAYDNRKPSESAVIAWGEVAERAHWTFELALEAIHDHYAESRDFLMPADITTRVRAMRKDAELRAIDTTPAELDPEAAERHRAMVNAAMNWGPESRPDPGLGALGVLCPHCHAAPRSSCTRPVSGGRRIDCPPHPSRWDAARGGAA